MSAEERWADRMEWEEEKRRGFNIEIKITVALDASECVTCDAHNCRALAVRRRKIGPVAEFGVGKNVDLCVDHDDDDNALEIYEEMIS